MALTPAFVVACGLLVLAGGVKVSDPRPAKSALNGVGIWAPAALVRALGLLEVVIGLSGALRPSALTGSLVAVTYAAFFGFVLWVLRAGAEGADCGCFRGAGIASEPPGALHLVLNAAACATGLVVALDPSRGLVWMFTQPPVISVTLIVGTAAAGLAAYLSYTVVPRAWRAYGSGEAG